MIPVRTASRVSRIVSLSFKVAGISETSDAVRALVGDIQKMIQLLIIANTALRSYNMLMAGNPLGWLGIGISALSGISMAQGFLTSGPSEFEEYRSRSPR